MPGAESIVFAFAHLRESADAAIHPVGVEQVPPAGQDLVGISLVADIPDQFIIGSIENVMDGNGQFNGPEARTQ